MTKFDVNIYRDFNPDLSKLSDDQLKEHFEAHQNEGRIFSACKGDVEILSMRWLRGKGVEVGAGMYPTKLFGNARSVLADCDPDLSFGGSNVDIGVSLDDPDFSDAFTEKFDFAIASHVLEHTDSFIRALLNLINIVRVGGLVYIVLPDKECLNDIDYIPDYEFNHHILEFSQPLIFSKAHDKEFIDANSDGLENINIHANLTKEYISEVKSGKISQEKRFMFHKHNYNYYGWTNLIFQSRFFLDNAFDCIDMRYGHLRKDCHFILRRTI